MKKYIIQLSFVAIGLAVFVREVYDLAHTNIFSLPLNGELIFYYLRCLFYFLALPIFFVCETLEFFGVLSGDEANHLHLHLFYNTVYFLLGLYGVFFIVEKIF